MENFVKEYFRLEKQLERLNNRLALFSEDRVDFEKQIDEINKQINQAEKAYDEVSKSLSLSNEKADKVRNNLIYFIKNTLGNIIEIKSRGKYPDLKQGLIIEGYIFWEILYNLQITIELEGHAHPVIYLKWNSSEWDTSGLENILSKALNDLSNLRFDSYMDSLNYFKEIAQSFIEEHVKVINK